MIPLVSMVLLTWNALEYTRITIDSVRRFTTLPCELVIVDNGSERPTVEYLHSLSDATVVYNAENRGFAGGCNQGIAASRGRYVMLLNNDVVVTEHWLDDMVAAAQRDVEIGIVGPRSNKVAGIQQLDVSYQTIDEMHRFAGQRRSALHGRGTFLDRVIGFCMLIDRRVIDRIGGLDETFGTGNFEDDDYCMRTRLAGYKIWMADDVFIHHYGHRTFAAAKIDYAATMERNWGIFAAKYGLDPVNRGGYETTRALAHPFDPARHRVPLDRYVPLSPARLPARRVGRLHAVVSGEPSWQPLTGFIRRYAKAFGIDDPVDLVLWDEAGLGGTVLERRIERLLEREGISIDRAGEIFINVGGEPPGAGGLGDGEVLVNAASGGGGGLLRATRGELRGWLAGLKGGVRAADTE